MLGVRRFDALQKDLGVARNVLQSRLERLVEHGVLERRLYQEHPPRYEYVLTEKGLDLWPTIVALLQWGDQATRRARAARRSSSSTAVAAARSTAHRICERCGERLGPRDVGRQGRSGRAPR